MPKVASEVKVQAHSGIRTPNRPADRAGGNPFAALLDTVTSPDRPAPKSDRVDPARQSRKSDAPEPQAEPSRDSAPAPQDSCAASTDTPSDKTESQDQNINTTVTADAAPAETKETVDADLAAAIDAAIPAPAAPQIVQAAIVVAAPSIAPTDAPAAETADAVPAIAAPASTAAAPDIAAAATPQPDAAKPATDQADAKAAPATDTGTSNDTKPTDTPDLSATQKQPRDGSHVKPEATAKDETPAKADAPAPAPKQAKADHVDADVKTAQPATSAPETPQTFTLGSLHAHATANAAPATAPAATSIANAVPMSGVAVEIATQARAGGNRFEIRLDPPELGRIDVRLDVDKNGQVTTHLRVDRVETLDMLRRDAQNLERTLQDAGLKTSGNALNFSLRDQYAHQRQAEQNTPNSSLHFIADDASLQTGGAQVSAWATRLGGIDIRI